MDITYINCLLYLLTFMVCIVLGKTVRRFKCRNDKRDCGALIGMFMGIMICGHYVLHSFTMVIVNIYIMRYFNKQYVHKASLLYTWSHLLLLHYYLSDFTYVIWYHQALALRLVGLSFEMFIADCAENKIDLPSSMELPIAHEDEPIYLDPFDIIGYAFFFAGVHRGPYYRWRHLKEYLEKHSERDLSDDSPVRRYIVITFCILVYLMLHRFSFTVDIYDKPTIYEFYRFVYYVPHLMAFYLRSQILGTLSKCVFQETGLAGYPKTMKPIAGHGPMESNSNRVSYETLYHSPIELSYETINHMDYVKVILGPNMVDTLRAWNQPSIFFFWGYIFKSFCYASKPKRNAIALLVWFLWLGPCLRTAIVGCTVWLYIYLEKEYGAFFLNYSETIKYIWKIGNSILRFLCLVYLTPCFIIPDSKEVIKYYNSVYWAFHCVLLGLLLIDSQMKYRMGKFDCNVCDVK